MGIEMKGVESLPKRKVSTSIKSRQMQHIVFEAKILG